MGTTTHFLCVGIPILILDWGFWILDWFLLQLTTHDCLEQLRFMQESEFEQGVTTVNIKF